MHLVDLFMLFTYDARLLNVFKRIYNLKCFQFHRPLPSSLSLEHLDNIEKLDLSYNQLTLVGSGVFRGLSRLRQLYLHNNSLTVVQHGSLDMLPGLEVFVAIRLIPILIKSILIPVCLCLSLHFRHYLSIRTGAQSE